MARKVLNLPEFNREEVFAEVDKSNARFDNYTPAQRKNFRKRL